MIRCVVFDFDGTLAQSNAIKRQGFFDIVQSFGDTTALVESVLNEVSGDREDICAELVRRLSKLGRLSRDRDEQAWTRYLVNLYTTYCDEQVAACPEVDGAGDTLESLRARGLSLYINSATPAIPLKRVVGLRGISGFFKEILGRPASKSENLRHIMAVENVSPDEIVLVGDNEVDRFAAGQIGCHFIGIENEFSRYETLPSILITDLRSLPQKITSFDEAMRTSVGAKRGHQ